ncbi:hypothetical protein GUITHDRAFT_117244 [Guillardia theta CCMP2712]|uniref:RWP-RK domain-containing protein n=1 Tax=Guillardia theta (strain CCMP2712) TaxID=905079 RepID=L1IK15_GUITC|nr:hypothetical protein GUITHDRAFT_117244 [Guillardia theta CCMP2712]EKX36588.1 hypothetical protein GUITHDRAFT_117244 [Guillardia theta CCMP2712]|eukprot:XP_005823568.1 hypothetical protein GUITHDRAFT_117244 [Guillardia theta CCMP2712]
MLHPAMTSSPTNHQTLTVKIFPRRKKGEDDSVPREPIYISLELLSRYFHLKQEEVASALGVSLTSFKGACRRVGLKKWPYVRSYTEEKGGSGEEESSEEEGRGSYEGDLGFWGELLEEALRHVEESGEDLGFAKDTTMRLPRC